MWSSLVQGAQSIAVVASALERTSRRTKPLAVVPPIRWDWPKLQAMVSPEQYNFSDFMPVTPESSELFHRSSSRFSSNYESFIQVLDPSAPPERAVGRAQAAFDDPDYKSYVLYRSRPAAREPSYYIQNYKDWLSGVQRHSGGLKERKIVTWEGLPPLRAVDGILAMRHGTRWTEAPLPEEAHELEMTAEAWGRIPITPAPWFDSGFIGIKANGPYLSGYSRSAQGGATHLFGMNGLLACRVSELIVVHRPSTRLTVNGELSSEHTQEINSASELRIGSSQFEQRETDVDRESQSRIVVTGTSRSELPLIIGVTVEFFT